MYLTSHFTRWWKTKYEGDYEGYKRLHNITNPKLTHDINEIYNFEEYFIVQHIRRSVHTTRGPIVVFDGRAPHLNRVIHLVIANKISVIYIYERYKYNTVRYIYPQSKIVSSLHVLYQIC